MDMSRGGTLILSVQQTMGRWERDGRSGDEGEIVEFSKNNSSFNIKKKRPGSLCTVHKRIKLFPLLAGFSRV